MIAIKDMKMPNCCSGCILCRVHNGGQSASCAKNGKELSTNDFFNKRPNFCPLVDIEEENKTLNCPLVEVK